MTYYTEKRKVGNPRLRNLMIDGRMDIDTINVGLPQNNNNKMIRLFQTLCEATSILCFNTLPAPSVIPGALWRGLLGSREVGDGG